MEKERIIDIFQLLLKFEKERLDSSRLVEVKIFTQYHARKTVAYERNEVVNDAIFEARWSRLPPPFPARVPSVLELFRGTRGKGSAIPIERPAVKSAEAGGARGGGDLSIHLSRIVRNLMDDYATVPAP